MANMFDQFDGDVATQEKQTVTPKSKNIFDQFDAAPAKALAKGNVFDQFDEQPKTAKEETTPSGPDPMATWLATKPEFRDRLSWQPSEEEKKKAGIEEGPPPESRRFVAAEPVEVTARAQKPRTPEELAQVQALQRQQVEKMGPPPSITTPTTESELKYERDRLEREAKDPVRPIGTLEEEYLANLERPYSRFAEKVLPAKLVQSPLIAAATELLDLPLKGMTSAARAASVEINKLQEAIRAGRPVEAAGRVATTVGELGMGAIAPLPVIQTIMAAQEGIGRISPGAGETITKAMTPAQTLQKKVAPGVKVSPTEEVGQQIVDLAWQLSLFGLGAKGVTKLKNWLIKGEPIAIGEIDAIRKAIEEANIPQEKKQAIQDLIEKAPYIPPEERARAIEGQPPPEQAGVVKSQPDPRVAQIAERVRQLKASNPTLSQADAEAISLQMPLPPPESKIIRPAGEITRREIAEVPPEKVTPLEKPIPAVEEALKPAEEISTLEPMKPRTGPGKEPTKITPQPEGRKIVETAEFKRWFRGSVVVDKSEKPMVVYHGSGADIKSFDPSLRGLGTGAESAKLGFFFTDSREVAQSYADRASSIENLKWLPDSRRVSEKQNELSYGMSRELNDYTTVFLKKHGTDEGALFDNKTLYEEYRRGYDKIAKHYQNQIDVLGRAAEKKHPQREREGKPTIVEAFLSLKHPKIVDAEGKGFVEIDAKGIIAEAKKTGYDGVIIRNVIDNFSLKEEILSDDYIVFSSDQIKITSPEPSRAPEVGAQTVPALKPTEVPTKKPVAQRSTREIVEDQGLRFDGEKRGLIYATDPKTGSTLALPSEGFTPDALAAHVEESRAKFTPEQLAAEAPQAEAKVEEPKPEKERVGIRRYLKSAYGSEFDRIPEMIAAGVKPEVVERLIPPIESAIEKDLNSGRLTDVEAQGLYERLETAKKQVADYRATKIAPARDWEQGGERRFAFDPNSTKNEGRFRLFPPKSVAPELYPEGTKHFRRQSSTPGVSYVMAKRPGEKQAITQAVRFDKKVISESQARDWWEKNKSRPEFQFYGGEKAVAETPKVEAKVEKKAAPAPKPPLSAGDEAWKSAIIGKLSEQGVKDLSDAEIERALAGTVSKTKLTAKAKELVQRGSITLDDVSPTSKPPEMMTEKQPWEMTADEYLRLEERSQAKGAAVTQMSSLIKQGKSPSEAAAAAPKAGLSLKEQKTTLLGELQRAQEVAKRFEQEYKKIDAAEDKVTSVRIEAQNKELEEFEKRKPEPGLVEENERYWKERNAIVDKRSKLGQADYKKFAAQRRIIDDRRADELRKEGFTVEEYRPGKSGMPEKSYRVMTEVPGDGTFYTPIDMLGEGIERIQKGFPTTGGTIPVPKGGGAPSGAGREARPYKNTISKTPDGKYFTVKGEVLIEGEAPKGYKVDELRPEIPLKSVKEILGSGTTDAKLLGYAIKDEVLGYDAVSVKRIPPTDEQPSAIFEANGKYYEINQDRLNLAHEYVKNPTYKLSEDGRALVLLENGKPKAAVGGRPQGESGLKTVTGVSADVMRERFGEQINYLIAPQERGKMPPGPEAKKAAAAKPAEAKPTFEEQTARRRMKEEGLSAEEAARQVISEKYSTLSDKQIEASKGHDSPLGREYRALIEGLKKQVEKPESARPTGTGLATFAVGSLLGIQKDDEGKWVYNPTLGLIGGLGGIALGMLSQKALGALREIESGVAKRGLFPRDAAKALAGEIETYLGTEGKNLPEAEKTQMRKLVNPEKLAEPVAQAEIQAKGESKGQPTPKPIEPLTGQSLKRRNDRIVNEIIRAAKEKAAEKAPRQPSKTILASLKEKIPEYRNDAVREGLNGMDVIERIRERLVDDLSSASEYSEITDARKANAFARLQTENVAGWLRRLEIQQKRWEIEQRVRARRFEIATDLADRIITRDLSVDLQKKLLATSAQFRYTPDTQGKVFAGFKSRVAVMADSYGAAGGELINRMYQGDITRGHFMEIGNDAISRVRDIYDKVDSPFERQRISDAVIDALEDRANPQKHLKTDTQKEIYKIASGLLDEFKSELTARGYAVREDYFTHIKDVDILEQVFNDVLDPRKESVGSLNQMIAARSRFLKPRLDVEMEIRRDLPYVLSTYVRSVSKELAYQNGVEYYYMQFQKDIPVALRRNSMERAMKMMRNTLNPERGRGMFYRSLNFIRSNEYRNFLGMNLKASAQNMTQPEFARWRWSPEADGLRKELWRKRNDLTGPLADAIEVAATDTPRFLEMIKEPGEERNRLVAEKFNQIDTFQMSERRNWSQSELGAILNSAMKEKPYQGFLTKFNGDKLKAVNEVLGNKDAFDRAVRDAAVTSAETQVAASPSMRGEYFDHPLARVALMFTAFRTRQLQILGQALGRQEGMNGARTKAILRRGMSGDVAPVEVLRELETSRKAMEKMLSEAKRVKENLGISYGDVQRYVDYLRLQERDLNRIIQKIEPLGGSRLRRAGMVGRYVAKIAAISLGTGLLWDSVDLAIGDTQKDEKDLIATALWRAFWDVFPSPIYGMNPSKFAVSPVIPNLEHATIYGKFSGRGLSRDALSYLLGALPWVGLVERATGKRISKAALNVAFPPKEKALPKGTMPGSTVPKKSPYQGSSYKKAKGYTYAVPNRSMLDILAETPA
jgi:hypothetical protein